MHVLVRNKTKARLFEKLERSQSLWAVGYLLVKSRSKVGSIEFPQPVIMKKFLHRLELVI